MPNAGFVKKTFGTELETELRIMSDSTTAIRPFDQVGDVAVSLAPARTRDSVLRRVFSFPAMMAALLAGGAFVAHREFRVDSDIWWHIKAGAGILATHHWPIADPYSFTVAGQPWLSYEWLGDVLLATVERIGGVLGLEILLIVLTVAIMLALYAFATLRSGNSKAAFLASAVLLPLVVPICNLRPQMLGYLFLILTLIALERFRQGKSRGIWFLPLLMLVWINTHGSWEVGLGVIFVYWMSGLKTLRLGTLQMRAWRPVERRNLSFVFLLCLAVLPITPYGARLAAVPFQIASSVPLSLKYILEWQPMPLASLGGKIFLGVILAFFAMQFLFRFTWRLEELVLFFFGVTMAFIHVRFLIIFVPFSVPLFATVLARWVPGYQREKDRPIINAILIAGVIGGVMFYFPARADIQKDVSRNFPVGAVNYLRQHDVPGPMLNNYGFGGYLVWTLGPERKVFIDGRSELYEHGGVLGDYMRLTLLQPGAFSVLQSYGIKSCLLNREEPLATALGAMPDWQKVYSDDLSVIFVRRSVSDLPRSTALARVSGRSEHEQRTN